MREPTSSSADSRTILPSLNAPMSPRESKSMMPTDSKSSMVHRSTGPKFAGNTFPNARGTDKSSALSSWASNTANTSVRARRSCALCALGAMGKTTRFKEFQWIKSYPPSTWWNGSAPRGWRCSPSSQSLNTRKDIIGQDSYIGITRSPLPKDAYSPPFLMPIKHQRSKGKS